ncbi:carbohydrate ABC transporter permease [Ruminococcus albus]|uniref:Multiple sugar transport system permease protein n=1 Tax=Ruminococcus albus TaxID=1264 RepID=A0A1I1KBX8_RUMAL|nr:sugar ABC transporter permease [Ruminococcus albus]SFC55583.1 multiple sugar transport system permease protein [Ruminococcus albus]
MARNTRGPMNKQGRWAYTWHMVKANKGCYLMLVPFMIFFITFTVVPVIMSLPMGFTNFNMIQMPKWVGLSNFYTLFVNDDVFLIAVRNTLIFAIFTGPFSYVLSFLIAWLINEMNPFLKTFFTFVFYAPSMTTSVYVTWQLILSGDSYGYLNAVLMDLGILKSPAQWITDTKYILTVVIIVQLWMSMGAGFLAIRAGFQNIDKSMYEAGAIEGIKNRWQELFKITIPSMGPQLLFAAVMQISTSFTVGMVGQNLVGLPSTDYAAHTIMNHATDYGWVRYEMGYSSAICFVLFAAMLLANKGVNWILGKYLD